uniref:Sulfotransferase n=1 Tax=Kalanchoe fedtschenkoi TaxID=63787 RepID=A0A7N0TVC4_KALFE
MATASEATRLAQVPCDKSELREECEKLLQSLPKAQGWVGSPPLYKYEGNWYYSATLQGVISSQKHFQSQHTDIILATIPKSGTTWLKAIGYSIVNRGRNADGTGDINPLLTNNPHNMVPFLEINLYACKGVPDLSRMPPPRLFATHLPVSKMSAQYACCKVVYLSRNPRDTFTSDWNFTNKLRAVGEEAISIEEAFDMFCNGISAFGPYWDHVLEYWKASSERPGNIMFLKYEDLKNQPHHHFKKMAEFLGYPFSKEEEAKGVVDEMVKLCSFDHLSNLQVNQSMNGKINGVPNSIFFRRGNVGDSKNFLSSGMIDRLDRIVKDQFSPFGLEF